VGRFTAEQDEDRREEFRGLLLSYVRLYGFVSQIAAFGDPDLEKLYAFGRLLRMKLPRRECGGILDLDDDVTLTYYRMDKTYVGAVILPVGEPQALTGPTAVGTEKAKDDALSPLSKVIDLINERFGADFTENDKLLMVQVVNDLAENEGLADQARTDTMTNFRHAFNHAAMDAVINRMERNDGITEQFMESEELRGMMLDAMMREFYQRVRGSEPRPGD
jgi:type I restriction enzyme, R subunit